MLKRKKKLHFDVLKRDHFLSQSDSGAVIEDTVGSLTSRRRKDVGNADRTTSSLSETSWNTFAEPSSTRSCLKVRTQAESLSQPLCRATNSKAKCKVAWSKIECHCHGITLGDNPSVSYGPPVALGSELLDSQVLEIDEYEEHRPVRRQKSCLLLPRMTRDAWLKEAGFSRSDFRRVEDEIRVIKKYRKANSVDGQLRERLLSITRLFYKGNTRNKSFHPPKPASGSW